jgi:hypothetical protein
MLSRLSLRGMLPACVVCILVLGGGPTRGADVKPPDWKHGMDLRVRKADEADFNDKTKKYGCEVYFDTVTNQVMYISETTSLSVLGMASFTNTKTKEPTWLHGLKLKARKAAEADFTKDTTKYGIEVFKDENTGLLIYVTETGSIAVVKPTGSAAPSTEVKAPEWSHCLVLKCRKGNQENFDDNTPKFGVEVYIDTNNGNLVYITEQGNIAVTPPPAAAPTKKDPKWLFGVEFRVRGADEGEFTKNTPLIGGEIFKDESTGNIVYITEKGSISVATTGKTDNSGKSSAPNWVKGFALKVRKANEIDFTKDTKKYGGELFEETNTGNRLFIMQGGMIAIAPGK